MTKMTKSINEYELVASVGDYVSVYVLVSSTHGLIVQICGFITRKSYQYACVLVNNHSDFT